MMLSSVSAGLLRAPAPEARFASGQRGPAILPFRNLCTDWTQFTKVTVTSSPQREDGENEQGPPRAILNFAQAAGRLRRAIAECPVEHPELQDLHRPRQQREDEGDNNSRMRSTGSEREGADAVEQ